MRDDTKNGCVADYTNPLSGRLADNTQLARWASRHGPLPLRQAVSTAHWCLNRRSARVRLCLSAITWS